MSKIQSRLDENSVTYACGNAAIISTNNEVINVLQLENNQNKDLFIVNNLL